MAAKTHKELLFQLGLTMFLLTKMNQCLSILCANMKKTKDNNRNWML
jgi:hypothetical protein